MLTVHSFLGTWTKRVSLYIALTEFMRRKFIQGGLPEGRITVKPNFVAPDPGMGDHSGGYALFVGRLSSEKGIQTLVEGWQRLSRTVPLKVAGTGSLCTLVNSSAPGIEWLGQRSRSEILSLMRQAQFLVFPAEWYEGFPLTIAEAFAAGLPVLASRLGSMAELVEDGSTGLLFTPGNPVDLAAKVEWAVAHPTELAKMGRRAREEFETKYSAERNYQLLYGIYQQMLGGRLGLDRFSTTDRARA
jgi:glycosyltransferase involved in cell wall biosynthesis